MSIRGPHIHAFYGSVGLFTLINNVSEQCETEVSNQQLKDGPLLTP